MRDRDGFSKGGWEVARAISCPASERFAATISGLVFRMVWRVVVVLFLVAMLHPSPCVVISAATPNRVVAAGLSPGPGLAPGSSLGDISIHSRPSPQPRTAPEEGALASGGGWEEEQEIDRDNGLDGMTELDEELDELERELDEAHEARAVAEKVNMQLKSAIEQQSLEIAALQAKINSTRFSHACVTQAKCSCFLSSCVSAQACTFETQCFVHTCSMYCYLQIAFAGSAHLHWYLLGASCCWHKKRTFADC